MADKNWMIYGAYGYTGQLLLAEALRRGHKPVIAGRNAQRLQEIAYREGLEYRTFGLQDEGALIAGLRDISLVFHAAGPYINTSAPMVDACLAAQAHYLDLTGEIPVFLHTFSKHDEAIRQQVALISGAGFDVIPSDCLAVDVAGKVEAPSQLEIALTLVSQPSGGTLQSLLEILAHGGFVRYHGELQPAPLGHSVKTIQFLRKKRTVMLFPVGDLVTAFHSTGIPNITTYQAIPRRYASRLRWMLPMAQRTLRARTVRRLARTLSDKLVQGPGEELLQSGRSEIWARATNQAGESAEGWLETMEIYRFTAVAGVRFVEQVLREHPTGALSPAEAVGPDFVLDLPDTIRVDELPIGEG